MMESTSFARGIREAVDATPGTVHRRRASSRQPISSASPGIADLTGYEPSELVDGERGWLDVVHPDDRERLRDAVAAAAPGEYLDECYRIRTAGGDVRRVRDRVVVSDGDPPELDGILVDVAGRVERREEREDDAELLDAIFRHIPIHVYVKDEEARHVHMSDHLDFPEDVIGKRDIDVDFIKEESARRAYEDDMRVIEEGETILDQEQYYPAVDEWDLNSKVPLRDEDGEVIGLLGATRRITERKRAQKELEEKTERLENFADVVAHDIRNPLGVARGYAELIDDVEDDEEYVEEVKEALERAEAIIDDVLALSREGAIEVDPERLSLTDVASDAWANVASASTTLELPDRDVGIDADPSRLLRVFENLFRNAVEHGGDRAAVEVLEGGEQSSSEGFAVEDNGPGIPAEERDQVFDTDYSTSEKGAGLGLGIVEEIAEAHGWSVRVADPGGDGDAVDRGARFEITGVELAAPPD